MSNKDVLFPASQANSSSENPSTKVFELELTQSQFKALQKLLPKGYTMEIVNRSRRDTSPLPSKKVLTNTNEGILSNKGSSNHLVNGTSHSDQGDSNVKSSTREKRRTYSTFEQRYPDFEAIPATSSKSFKPSNEGIKRCSAILQKLRAHNSSAPFLEPVDVVGLGLDDYYEVVSDPMDLSTVDRKLRNGDYNTVNSFAAEVRRIWQNAFAYNPKGSQVYTMALEMSAYFEKLFKEVENYNLNGTVRSFEKKVKASRQNGDYSSKSKFSKGKFSSAGMDRPMSIQEKKTLATDISNLSPEHLRGVWEIVSKAPSNFQKNKEELEFDIDALPPRIARELERFVRNKLNQQASRARKKGKESASSKPNSTLGANDINTYDHTNKQQQQHPIGLMEDIHGMIPQVPEDLVPNGIEDAGNDKTSESSFFSDSEDGGDRGDANVVSSHSKGQDLSTFQAGGHGSMLNSFIVK